MSEVRDLLNVPFHEFRDVIKFRQDHMRGSWRAVVGSTVVGEITLYPSDEAVREWKADVFRKLAHFSKTAELKTACGCSRLIDGHSVRERGILVPLWRMGPTSLSADGIFDVAETMPVREFRQTGKLSSDGFRLYEEYLP